MTEAKKTDARIELTRAAIAKLIASDFAPNLGEYALASLRKSHDELAGPDADGSDAFFNVELRDGPAGSTTASFAFRWQACTYDNVIDEDGNVVRQYRPSITVNASTYGSDSLSRFGERLAFYNRLHAFATDMAAPLPETVTVTVRTAEEDIAHKANQERLAAERRINNTVRDAADVVRGGMRVNHKSREIPMALLPNVPVGVYNVSCTDYNGKVERTYEVRVYAARAVIYRRS